MTKPREVGASLGFLSFQANRPSFFPHFHKPYQIKRYFCILSISHPMKKAFFLTLIMAIGIEASMACTNLIVGKKASTDGSVMCTYNCDGFAKRLRCAAGVPSTKGATSTKWTTHTVWSA